ncbi:carbon monoxide dehydrogenase, medium subunit [Mycolicibacterium rhodesiae JS60]|nr:carbon monoxide dehydrogenase, medium subunit [Mycolicibacterium rhodesiae JS60]
MTTDDVTPAAARWYALHRLDAKLRNRPARIAEVHSRAGDASLTEADLDIAEGHFRATVLDAADRLSPLDELPSTAWAQLAAAVAAALADAPSWDVENYQAASLDEAGEELGWFDDDGPGR